MTTYTRKPVDEAAKAARHILVATSMRWAPYKPSSEQYRKGIKGRWQVATDYGWENASQAPETYLVETGE